MPRLRCRYERGEQIMGDEAEYLEEIYIDDYFDNEDDEESEVSE